MGFNGAEFAITSEPVELLFFARDESYWAYTTHDEDLTRGAVLYRAGLVTRAPFQQGDELNQISTTVQISTETDLGALLQSQGASGNSGPLFMRLMLTHANDTATITPFFGQANAVSRHGSYVEVTVGSVMDVLKRKLLRVSGGTQCSHALYDSGCGVNMENFRVDGTLMSISGRFVNAASGSDPLNTLQTAEYYAGGILMYGREKYFIEHNNTTGDLTMESVLPSYIIGQPIILYAGCDRSYETCQAKFSNERNFAGFPEFPIVNPFEGTR